MEDPRDSFPVVYGDEHVTLIYGTFMGVFMLHAAGGEYDVAQWPGPDETVASLRAAADAIERGPQ